MESEEEDTSCGYTKSCKPTWLQRFSNIKTFLVVSTLFTIVQGFCVNGVNNSNTVMYERRYQLTSKETSFISTVFDLGAGLIIIPVGYYAAKRHQPRLMAVSCVVMVLGLFIMCLAQFASPPYNPTGFTETNGTESNICTRDDDALDACDAGDNKGTNLKNYFAFLLIGQIFNGFTGGIFYTLAPAFIEISSTSAHSALYLGIFASGSVLGPALGFLGGGALLDVYVDYPKEPPTGLTADSPAWVGAWWIGFVIGMVLLVILAILLFLFPHEFPETAVVCAEKVSEAHEHKTKEKISEEGFGMSWRQLPKATWYLIKNPVYLSIAITDAIELGLVIGFATFVPKLLVVVFYLEPSWAAILTGLVAIPAAVIGNSTGGAILKKWNLNVKQTLKLCIVFSVISMCLLPVYLGKCPDITIKGVNSDYLSSESLKKVELNSTCNDGCGCTTALYDPVCSNGVQYFSPCHAGCPEQPLLDENGGGFYHNCSCPLELDKTYSTATRGACDGQCSLLYTVYVPFAFLQFLFGFLSGTPMTIAALRVIPPEIRTYGMAVNQIFLRLLGSVPVPLLFGAMFDASCAVWQDNCGTRGSCWVYNNTELVIRLTVLVVVLKLISVTFNILALKLYKPPATDVDTVSSKKETFEDNSKNNPMPSSEAATNISS